MNEDKEATTTLYCRVHVGLLYLCPTPAENSSNFASELRTYDSGHELGSKTMYAYWRY